MPQFLKLALSSSQNSYTDYRRTSTWHRYCNKSNNLSVFDPSTIHFKLCLLSKFSFTGCGFDSYPNGCPHKYDPVEHAHKMAEQGITLYCVGCEPSITPFKQFFVALALITGGKYVPLANATELTKVIIGGAREEVSMEKLMAQVHDEVMKEAAAKGTRVDEDELTKRIHKLLNQQGNLVAIIFTIFSIYLFLFIINLLKTDFI
jgi:hypothetical protein